MVESGAGVPPGFRTVTPMIFLMDAAAAIDFYRVAFGAEETKRVPGPGNTLAHAEIRIGDCVVVLVDQLAGSGHRNTGASSPRVELVLYTGNADLLFQRALDAGATMVMPMSDVFWGDRYGKVLDPFGQVWALATRRQNLTVDEVVARRSVSR